jgi:hypothetical protein
MSAEAEPQRLASLLSATSKKADQLIQRAAKIKSQMDVTEEVVVVVVVFVVVVVAAATVVVVALVLVDLVVDDLV